jgi:hypothetical protein
MASSAKKKKTKRAGKYSAKSKALAAMKNSSTRVSDGGGGGVAKKRKGKKKSIGRGAITALTKEPASASASGETGFKPPVDVADKPLPIENESQTWFKNNPGKRAYLLASWAALRLYNRALSRLRNQDQPARQAQGAG